MNFFGIGLPEMAVIAAIGLLVFGPKRLPELGRTLGRTLKGFQSASSEFEKEFRSAIATAEAPSAETAGFVSSSGPAAPAGGLEVTAAASSEEGPAATPALDAESLPPDTPAG